MTCVRTSTRQRAQLTVVRCMFISSNRDEQLQHHASERQGQGVRFLETKYRKHHDGNLEKNYMSWIIWKPWKPTELNNLPEERRRCRVGTTYI